MRGLLATLRQRDALLYWCGLGSFLALALAAVLAIVDPRTLLGVSV